MRIVPALLAALCLTRAAVRAGESIQAAAGDVNPIQVLGAGARPLALGSAFTAVGGDLASLYFNPAGLGLMKGSRASLNHHNWLGGISQETLGFAVGGRLLAFGLSGDLVNYGSFDATDENGNALPAFTAMDMTVGFDLARGFNNGVALGGRLRVTQQNIADSGQLSSAGDFGAMWQAPGSPFAMGLSYSNFGAAVNGHAPASILRLGLGYDFRISADYGVLVLLGASGLSSGGQQIQAGAEVRLASYLSARAGYQAYMMDQQYHGLSGLSAGLGASFGFFSLDYAYLPYGRAGDSHRVSLNINFFQEPAGQARQAGAAQGPARPAGQAPPKPVRAMGADSVDLVFEAPARQGRSEAELKAAVADDPKDAKSWHELGSLYYRAKRYSEMIPAFQKVLELNPRDEALRHWLGLWDKR